MAQNLHRLSIYFDMPGWGEIARKTTGALENAIVRYPISFSCWASLVLEIVTGTCELAITGDNPEELFNDVISQYIPNKVIMKSGKMEGPFPLLNGKATGPVPLIFLCRNYTCQQPVNSVQSLVELLLKA
jgi:uncharacterized protein YyaL (SSP411 family)